MQTPKIPYRQIQACLGAVGGFFIARVFADNYWWWVALAGVGAIYQYVVSVRAMKGLGLPGDATLEDYLEMRKKIRAQRP